MVGRMERGQVILVDTNIIIEAVRTRSWNAIASYYSIETVETCRSEALQGDALRPGYVTVEPEQLHRGLKAAHGVSDTDRARLSLAAAAAGALDAGERDLFSHALGRSDAWLATCADRAALNVALALGWEGRIVSLEKLAQQTGTRAEFKFHFTEKWLASIRTVYTIEKGLK